MDKNQFLVINDLVYDMYNWRSLEDITENFFQRLKLIHNGLFQTFRQRELVKSITIYASDLGHT